jgi:GNAT superfamily N-acetyltransferase
MVLDVRDARPEDADAVAALLGELGYPSTASEVAQRLELWLAEPHSRVLLAIDRSGVVGSMSVHAIPHLERNGRWLRIESLVVSRESRGNGAGRLLVDAAEKLAETWGCHAIEVTSSRHREGAHAFYRRLGFEDRCITAARFWKELA